VIGGPTAVAAACDARPVLRPRTIGVFLATALAAAAPAHAHDYWMVPSELVVPGDRDVTVSLFVGEDFVAKSEKPFERARFTKLVHLHGGATEDLAGAGVDGSIPMVRLPLRGAGGHLIVVERNPSRIELPADRFETYLRHEGLGAVIAERARLGESGKPGRERYSRYLKTLIQVGRARDQTAVAITGQPLEIIPEADPVFVEPGGTLAVTVRFRGRFLAGARVEAFSRSGADIRGATYTTDAAGRIPVTIDRRGVWLLRMVHMIRCEACPDVDWESFWSSYTFASADPSVDVVAAPSMFVRRSWLPGALRVGALIAVALVLGAVAFRFVRGRARARPR
jgi:uncharacterized GH25 family protein